MLRIEARDYAGVEAEPLDLAFEVVPAWWQRDLVRSGFVIAGALLVVGVAGWRTRKLQRQKESLEAEVASRTEELHDANARLRELSYTDALTGLPNRRRFLEVLHGLVEPGGTGSPCSLIFLDVDHFKAFNDRYGHPAGDRALKAVGRSLGAVVTSSSLSARYGGEEFAVLLPATGVERAAGLAERIREDVANRQIEIPGRPIRERVTISAGVASRVLASEADVHELLREADVALYRAKGDGRNCVRVVAPS